MQRVNGHVYLIDDDQSMRSSLGRTLRESGYLVQDYGSAQDFLAHSLPASPAVILMEMQIPDMTGIELQQRLSKIERHTPIIFISAKSEPQQIIDGLKNGAVDFLLKPFGMKQLLESINKAMKLDIKQVKKLVGVIQVSDRFKSLTPREGEVCALLVQGLKSKEVAQKLGITPSTVKIQKAKMMKKMQASSVLELATLYTKHQLNE